jgi:hypothetical protein
MICNNTWRSPCLMCPGTTCNSSEMIFGTAHTCVIATDECDCKKVLECISFSELSADQGMLMSLISDVLR